ncbi:hypothetical protein ACWFMI_12510 [Nocardiopsis terrae]
MLEEEEAVMISASVKGCVDPLEPLDVRAVEGEESVRFAVEVTRGSIFCGNDDEEQVWEEPETYRALVELDAPLGDRAVVDTNGDEITLDS